MKQDFLILKCQTTSDFIDDSDCAALIPISELNSRKELIEQAGLFCFSNKDANSIEVSFMITGFIIVQTIADKDDEVIQKILSSPNGSIQSLEFNEDFYESIQSDGTGYLCICNALDSKLEPEIVFKKTDEITGEEFFTDSHIFSKIVPSEEPEFA